jgi:drug/metabolite transporter (DMT)-like permease
MPTPSARARGGALRPYLFLTLAALFWSGNFVVGRAVQGRVPPVGLAFWRWTVALAILLAVARRGLRAQRGALLGSWKALVALGILGVGNFNMFVYVGLGETSATNALLLQSACPAFIVAIAAATGSARATARQVAGMALSLAGVVAILTRGAPGTLAALSFSRGDLWVLAAVLSWAVYTLLLVRRPAGVEPLVLIAALVVVGVAWIAPFHAVELVRGERMSADATTVAAVLYVAVFPSVLAYWLWNEGVARVGPSRAGVFLHLMPAFGSILAVVALGESFRVFHAVGLALILAGVFLAGGPAARRERGPDRAAIE